MCIFSYLYRTGYCMHIHIINYKFVRFQYIYIYIYIYIRFRGFK